MIKNIIKGWWRRIFKKNNELANERLAICKNCEHNLNGWCGLCGCNLKAKARVEEEICHDGKW